MGLDDPYTAYCFDEAVYLWGAYVENELREAGEGAKTKKQGEQKVRMRISQLLNPPKREAPVYEAKKEVAGVGLKAIPAKKGRFRDPASMFRK